MFNFPEYKNQIPNVSLSKWEIRYVELANLVASWSRDPSTKVGAVLFDNKKRLVSVGFNGFPQGCNDAEYLYQDRETKYSRVVHSEVNCLLFANRRDLSDCTLITVPFMPCARCAGPIIQSGIKTVISPICGNERWAKDFQVTEQMFKEAGVKLRLYDERLRVRI